MRARTKTPADVQTILEAALRGDLTEEQARQLALCGPEAVAMAALAMARRIAELPDSDREEGGREVSLCVVTTVTLKTCPASQRASKCSSAPEVTAPVSTDPPRARGAEKRFLYPEARKSLYPNLLG